MSCTACKCEQCNLLSEVIFQLQERIDKLEKNGSGNGGGNGGDRRTKKTHNPGAIIVNKPKNELGERTGSSATGLEDKEAWHITYGFRDRLGLKSSDHVLYMDRGTIPDRETLERIKKVLQHRHNADMVSIHGIVAHYPDGTPSETKFNANTAGEVKRTGKQYTKDDLRDTFKFEQMKNLTSQQMLDNSISKAMPALGWDRGTGESTRQLLSDIGSHD